MEFQLRSPLAFMNNLWKKETMLLVVTVGKAVDPQDLPQLYTCVELPSGIECFNESSKWGSSSLHL